MSQASSLASDQDKLRALRVDLRGVRPRAEPTVATLAPKLVEALGVGGALAFAPREVGGHMRVAFGSEAGAPGLLAALDALLLEQPPARWAWLFPERPTSQDRNRVRAPEELGACRDAELAPTCALLTEFGVTLAGFLRVVVCEGDALLAHVAIWGAGVDAEARELLQSLVSPLAQRLAFDHALSDAPRARATLRASLARIGAPAWVVSASAQVEEANTAGIAQLERDRALTLERIRIAIELRRDAAGLSVTPIASDDAPAFLVVQQSSAAV